MQLLAIGFWLATQRGMTLRASAVLTLIFLTACATVQQGPSAEEEANVRLGGDAVVVLPLQSFHPSAGPPLSSELSAVHWQRLREAFNDTLKNAFVTRGVAETWIWPEQLRQAHRRNPALVPDAYELPVGSLRGMRLEPDADLPEQLGERLRTLLAVSDGRRYFLLPVDVVLAHGAAGFSTSGQLLLIDGRRQRVVWARRMVGAPEPSAQAALASYAAGIARIFMGTD